MFLVNLWIFATVIKIFFPRHVHISVLVFCLFHIISASFDFHLSFITGHLERFQRLTQEGSTLYLRLFPNPNFSTGRVWNLAHPAGASYSFLWMFQANTMRFFTFFFFFYTFKTYCFVIVWYTVCKHWLFWCTIEKKVPTNWNLVLSFHSQDWSCHSSHWAGVCACGSSPTTVITWVFVSVCGFFFCFFFSLRRDLGIHCCACIS